MGTAVGPAIVWLMENTPAAVAEVDAQAVVSLGWPDAVADNVLVFGRTAPDDPTSENGMQGYQELGAGRITEEFALPFFIGASAGGGDSLAAALAAIAIFDALIALIRAPDSESGVGLTLGGALQSGRYAQVTTTRMRATADAKEAEAGRRWVITGTITCKNIY